MDMRLETLNGQILDDPRKSRPKSTTTLAGFTFAFSLLSKKIKLNYRVL